jgi:rhodanese-related sulfurtransferase
VSTTVFSSEPDRYSSGYSRFWLKALLQGGAIVAVATVVGLVFNGLRPDKLPLVQDWSISGQLAAAKPGENLVVSLDEAKALFFTRGALFIDARAQDFYEMGHIQGSRSLPLEDIDSRLQEVMADVPPDTLIIVYCDGDTCSLSKDLALSLTGNGYQHVQVLLNGWSIWQDAGMPTEQGPPSP